MNKTKTILVGLLIATVAIAGCVEQFDDDSTTDAQNELANDTNTDLASANDLGASYLTEMRATEENQQSLYRSDPIPDMSKSLERQNLIRRYETLNDQNEVFHVYLMSHGKVVSYFTAQGKVSSVNSKLTNPKHFVECDRGSDGEWEKLHNRDDDCVVPSPQLDGSYGTNGDGVFFFTTDGSYVEWNGEYVVSQRPLNIQTPVSLESDVDLDE